MKEFNVGNIVKDLNGNIKTITNIISGIYEIDGKLVSFPYLYSCKLININKG